MEASYPSNLRVWEGTAAVVSEVSDLAGPRLLPGAGHAAGFAAMLFATEVWAPAGMGPDPVVEPYSLQWYLDIEERRFSRRGRWIPRLLEFSKHAGETLLGLGTGLGTDWVQYARHGASVVVCCPAALPLTLIRRNFELRGLGGRFLHSPADSLPLESASIDVACVSNLLQEVERPQAVVNEIYRVLKPGGKVLAVAPARYDVDFWYRTCFFWQRWLGASKHFPLGSRKYARFSGRSLRRLFARYVEHRIHKRQLRRSDVPHIWRWAPLSALERLMGRALVLKAFKPLSAAIPTAAAA